MIRITHSAAEGSLARGSTRGDGAAPILKANGWRWSKTMSAWYQPLSIDKEPRIQALERTRNQLTDAGLEAELEIDFVRRTTTEIEQQRETRALRRADHLNKRAETATQTAAGADARSKQISAGIPTGQPILVGHHSESRHRRDLKRLDKETSLAISAEQGARANKRRAEIAASESARRRDPVRVARHIADLEREKRKLLRPINGYTNTLGDSFKPASGAYRDRLEKELQTVADKLAYWQRVRQSQIDEGRATNYNSETVAKGDSVQYRGRWYEVVRANPKSVSIRSQIGGSWTDTLPYAELTGHCPVNG